MGRSEEMSVDMIQELEIGMNYHFACEIDWVLSVGVELTVLVANTVC